jgi:heme A synthase
VGPVLSTLHRLLSVVLVFAALGGALLAISRLRSGSPGDRLQRWSRVAAVLVVVDAALGGLLALSGSRPHESLHLIVGPGTVLALPLALVLAWRSGRRAQTWWLLLGWLALLGLCLRAVGTGTAVQ